MERTQSAQKSQNYGFLNSPLWNTLLIFVLGAVSLYFAKPEPMFDENGVMRSFGFGKNKTCFTFTVITFSLAMIVYSILTIFQNW